MLTRTNMVEGKGTLFAPLDDGAPRWEYVLDANEVAAILAGLKMLCEHVEHGDEWASRILPKGWASVERIERLADEMLDDGLRTPVDDE